MSNNLGSVASATSVAGDRGRPLPNVPTAQEQAADRARKHRKIVSLLDIIINKTRKISNFIENSPVVNNARQLSYQNFHQVDQLMRDILAATKLFDRLFNPAKQWMEQKTWTSMKDEKSNCFEYICKVLCALSGYIKNDVVSMFCCGTFREMFTKEPKFGFLFWNSLWGCDEKGFIGSNGHITLRRRMKIVETETPLKYLFDPKELEDIEEYDRQLLAGYKTLKPLPKSKLEDKAEYIKLEFEGKKIKGWIAPTDRIIACHLIYTVACEAERPGTQPEPVPIKFQFRGKSVKIKLPLKKVEEFHRQLLKLIQDGQMHRQDKLMDQLRNALHKECCQVPETIDEEAIDEEAIDEETIDEETIDEEVMAADTKGKEKEVAE